MVRAGPVHPVGGDPQGDGTAGRAYSQGISGTASASLCRHRKVSCRPVPWPPVPTFVAQSDYAPRGDLAGSAHDRPGLRSGALVFSGAARAKKIRYPSAMSSAAATCRRLVGKTGTDESAGPI